MVILLFNFIDITYKIKLVDVLKEYKDHSSLWTLVTAHKNILNSDNLINIDLISIRKKFQNE